MADFELAPDYQFSTEVRYDTLITRFENGAEQRRPRRENSVTEFTLQYKNRTSDDLGLVEALFNEKMGAFSSFTWLNPEDGEEYTVRFKEDSFKKTLKHYGIWDFEFTLTTIP